MIEQFKDKPVFVRTVTHHYTGKLTAADSQYLVIEEAAWIADDGRFADALATGTLNEVEPYPDGPVLLGVGAVLDVSEWKHDLPRTQK